MCLPALRYNFDMAIREPYDLVMLWTSTIQRVAILLHAAQCTTCHDAMTVACSETRLVWVQWQCDSMRHTRLGIAIPPTATAVAACTAFVTGDLLFSV